METDKSMTAAHTPGPWTLATYNGSDLHINGPQGAPQIAEVNGNGTYDQRHANAALIAAAPELVAALESAEDRIKELSAMINLPYTGQTADEIRAALAAARGE